MDINRAFTFFNNIMGLNFYEQKISLSFVMFIHLAAIVYDLIIIYFAVIMGNPTFKRVYIAVDFVQILMPVFIGIFFVVRAMLRRNFDQEFSIMTQKLYEISQVRKNQQKFFIFISISCLIQVFRLVVGTNRNSLVYNFSMVIPSLICTSSDFLFVYEVRCLNHHLKWIRETKCDVRNEMLQVIEVKRLIHERYSTNISISITLYFLRIIFSLYWIFVRFVFGYFNDYHGELSFWSYEAVPSDTF